VNVSKVYNVEKKKRGDPMLRHLDRWRNRERDDDVRRIAHEAYFPH